MHRIHLGEFEELVLLLVAVLHGNAYGVSVMEEIEQQTGRSVNISAVHAALRRLGFGKDEVTAHGFRATASTLLNENGRFSSDAIERALAHQDPDPVRRAYARGSFWKERVEMAQWWADHLDLLRKGGEVVSFRQPA